MAIIDCMDSRPLRIGLAGFGAMGKVHAFAVKNLSLYYDPMPFSATIIGICTTSPQKSQQIARQHGFSRYYESIDDMIADPTLDIIDICTPNISHYEIICKALDAGKHVLCEKPLCLTLGEASDLVGREQKSGKTCGMVFNNRFMAPIQRANQLIREGRIGKLLTYQVSYLHNSSVFADRAPGWKQTAAGGGGVLADLGSHIIDLIAMMCGPFDRVQALSQIGIAHHANWETDAEEAFYILAKMKNGACGTITASKLAIGTNDDLNLEIYGDKGSLRYHLMEPNWLYFYDGTRPDSPIGGECGFTRIACGGHYPSPGGSFPSPKAAVGWTRCHVESMYRFLSSVATNSPFSPSLQEGAYVQAVMQAARESAATGKEQEVKVPWDCSPDFPT